MIKLEGFLDNRDEDYLYINNVRASIFHADPNADISFFKNKKELIVHIKKFKKEWKQDIIDNLLAIHKIFHLKIIFSKSLAISNTISYSINLEMSK